MNIKFKRSVQLWGIILSLLLASNAYAWSDGKACSGPNKWKGPEAREGMGNNGDRMEKGFRKISKELGLTPEQEEQLKSHKEKSREERKEFRKKISDKMKELGEELDKQELDMGRVNQLHAELKALHSEMEDNRLNDILKVREILTPEQFAKFRAFANGHHNGMKRHNKNGGNIEEGIEKGGDE